MASYLPQISVDALFGYQHTAIPLPKFVSPTGEKIIIDTQQIFPSLVIQWLLFDFGKRDCMIEAAKQLSYSSNVAFTEAHQKLIFEVAKAYFNFNAARIQLHVAEEALINTEILQDAAESKLARALEKTTEMAIARRETAKARFDLEEAKANNNDAYHGLLETIGLTPTLRLQIAEGSGRILFGHGNDMLHIGLYINLEPWKFHFFHVQAHLWERKKIEEKLF
jgi:outer membrane protein